MSLNKKLVLKKDTPRGLSGVEMQGVVGGAFNYALVAKVDWTTMTCATCGCPKPNVGAFILPTVNQFRAF